MGSSSSSSDSSSAPSSKSPSERSSRRPPPGQGTRVRPRLQPPLVRSSDTNSCWGAAGTHTRLFRLARGRRGAAVAAVAAFAAVVVSALEHRQRHGNAHRLQTLTRLLHAAQCAMRSARTVATWTAVHHVKRPWAACGLRCLSCSAPPGPAQPSVRRSMQRPGLQLSAAAQGLQSTGTATRQPPAAVRRLRCRHLRRVHRPLAHICAGCGLELQRRCQRSRLV